MQFKKSGLAKTFVLIVLGMSLILSADILASPSMKATPALLKMLTIEEVTSSQVQDSLRL